jgi:hypothetical protein
MEIAQSKFQEIYDAFQPKILRYLTRMPGSHEVEDLAAPLPSIPPRTCRPMAVP